MSDEKIKVSVIIPVYNVEKYLEECLNSIINQTLKDIEIICVNDGSTDGSLNILNNFADKDKRVKVITQSNSGLGASRNVGMDFAKGKYIYFVDSDDYISLDAAERLYDVAERNNSDVVIFKIARFMDDKNQMDYSKPGFDFQDIFSNVDFDDFSFDYHEIKQYVLNASYSACAKLYKQSFLEQYADFKFQINTAFEDVLFHVKVLLRARKISFVPEYFYNYRLSNTTSITHTSSKGNDIFYICDSVENFLVENNFFEEFYNEFYFFKIVQLLNYILLTNTEEYYNKTRNEFLKIDLDNNPLIGNYYNAQYNFIVNSGSFSEFLVSYYNLKIDILTNNFKKQNDELVIQNNLLSNDILDFKKQNDELVIQNNLLSNDILDFKKQNDELVIQNNMLKKQKIKHMDMINSLKINNKIIKEENNELVIFKNNVISSKFWKLIKFMDNI